jgi:hypothetical protein
MLTEIKETRIQPTVDFFKKAADVSHFSTSALSFLQ